MKIQNLIVLYIKLVERSRNERIDYGSNGAYFVTICTKDRRHYFGEIVNYKMQFSKIGEIANSCWKEIPDHFPFVILDEFVIMPDHVHGIIIIDKETQNFASPTHNPKNKFGPQSQNLASIIRGYKVGVKKFATINKIDFAWQSRFHDHIIRNDKAFHNIAEYIRKNPIKWNEGK